MVARTLLDGLRECLHDQEQTDGMLDYMSRFVFVMVPPIDIYLS